MKHLSMQELEDLGFEVVESYTHDEYISQQRVKGVIGVETFWDITGRFIGQDFIFIADFKVNAKELKQLDKILNKNN